MAGRVTQLPIEISGTGQVPSARVTQLVAEISGVGQVPSGRVTQLVIEISTPAIYNFIGLLTDTLNLSDTVVVDLVISEPSTVPLTQVITDDLNIWSELVTLGLVGNFFQEVASQLDLTDSTLNYTIGHLSEVVASTLELSDAINTLLPIQLETSVASTLANWLDSFSIFSPQLVFKQLEDYFTLSDLILSAIADELTVTLSDTLSPSDVIVYTLEQRIQQTDSLNNWQDILDQIEFLSRLVSSNLNNWTDVISSVRNWSLSFSDRLVLDDKIKVSFLLLALLTDTLTQSDAQLLRYNTLLPLTDDFTLSDDSSVFLSIWIPNTVADSMSMTDGISSHLSTFDDDYYRRYLDDRNLMIGELKTFYCDSMTMRDTVGVS